jgi:methionyl-tRNA formyltransferase
MKIVFIGTVELSKQSLLKLVNLNAEIQGVVARRQSPYNADFADLTEVCEKNQLSVYHTDDINKEACIAWIKDKAPDILFCFGWSQLLKEPLLSLAPRGVIGFHPSLLPLNRGRHPIIWALALGLEKTGSTFFFMDGGADSGDILSQREVPIAYEDTSQMLYNKIMACALKQIENFLPALSQNQHERIAQDHTKATYWRKRTQQDGLIDWRMPARGIYNLVRSLTRPYVGANAHYDSTPFKIWSVSEKTRCHSPFAEPGKVIGVDRTTNSFTVKCGTDAINVIDHELRHLPNEGDYL